MGRGWDHLPSLRHTGCIKDKRGANGDLQKAVRTSPRRATAHGKRAAHGGPMAGGAGQCSNRLRCDQCLFATTYVSREHAQIARDPNPISPSLHTWGKVR